MSNSMSLMFERELISACDRLCRQLTAHIEDWNLYQFFEFRNYPDAYLSKPTTDQGWRNRSLAVHERVNCRFLVLPGSLFIFTQITRIKHFSLQWLLVELRYESEQNIVPLSESFINGLISFLWNTIFTFYYVRVRPQFDFSILGRTYV